MFKFKNKNLKIKLILLRNLKSTKNSFNCLKIIFIYILLIIIFLSFRNVKRQNNKKYSSVFASSIKKRYKINNNLTIIFSNLEYSFSFKYNITEIKYQYNFYDDNNLIIPSNLTLLYDLKAFCFLKDKNDLINLASLANIYENKYFYCIEYFKINEKLNFGVKIFKKHYFEHFYFFPFYQLNYNNLYFRKEIKFSPLIISKEYNLTNELLTLNKNKSDSESLKSTYTLKKSYAINPIYSSKTNLNILNDEWSFLNIYNHYFCLCKGFNCFPMINQNKFQKCKYDFNLNIIDNNRNIYDKTDYLFADFFLSNLSSDDAYPIFEEMIKNNKNVHYITQNKHIYKKYCRLNDICLIIIRDIIIDGDYLEKYLDLILKLKVAVSGSEFLSIKNNGHIFHDIEYITSINVGHGVKYFKSFLYKRYSNYKKFNKLLLSPSKKIISVALKYGWKEQNIIKMCLPKWDKYDKSNIKLDLKKQNKRSIFIFFTKRNLKNRKIIPLKYIKNILKIINSNILEEELIKNNITLYYCLHRSISRLKYMIKKNNKKLVYINNHEISSVLIHSSLLITDFSSIIFDFIYQRKPVIMYLPDLKAPMIKNEYDKDYYKLINDIKIGKIYFVNKLNSTYQVINKIIYYINNNFKLEDNLKEYYDSFEFKCGKNITHSFIKYIENLK